MDPKEASIYYAAIIAAVMLGVILLYFLLAIIRQQRSYRLLNTAHFKAEINMLETERARIASDLHDEIGPVLSTAKNKLDSMDQLSPDVAHTVDECMEHIDSIIIKMRGIAKALMPNSLLTKGPVYAIKEFIQSLSKNGLSITLNHEQLPFIEPSRTIHIYRILQEIIHNSLKHSGGTQLMIIIKPEQDKLIISTADNGKGFLYNKFLPGKGLGLNIMESRVAMLEGEMFIKTKPGKGTAIFIKIPLNHAVRIQ